MSMLNCISIYVYNVHIKSNFNINKSMFIIKYSLGILQAMLVNVIFIKIPRITKKLDTYFLVIKLSSAMFHYVYSKQQNLIIKCSFINYSSNATLSVKNTYVFDNEVIESPVFDKQTYHPNTI